MTEYKDEMIAETMTKLRLDLSLVRNVTYLHLTLYIPIFLLVVLTLVGNLIPGKHNLFTINFMLQNFMISFQILSKR